MPTATEEEIEHTIAVMGGEDWQMWIEALDKAGVLAKGAVTVAYSYIGPDVTTPVYRNGTIGAAKDHLEATAHKLDAFMKKYNGRAFVSVNKALVTQSSSAIPFIPLYFVLLMRVMKKKNIHEDCIHQVVRLFHGRLYNGRPLSEIPTDPQGRVRVDDLEMRQDVQDEVSALWKNVLTANVNDIADVKGYEEDFLKLFGFGLKNVDYDADVEVDLSME